MTKHILDELELSVRTANVLRKAGHVTTLADFMALDRKTVAALKGAGVRVWREIETVQQGLGRDTTDQRQDDWQRFRAAVGALNDMMMDSPQFRTCDAGRGFLVAVWSERQEADARTDATP